MTDENPQAAAAQARNLASLRIYLKDVSFETPNSPAIFTQEFKPDINLQLNTPQANSRTTCMKWCCTSP